MMWWQKCVAADAQVIAALLIDGEKRASMMYRPTK
jgi:hypothetical protein